MSAPRHTLTEHVQKTATEKQSWERRRRFLVLGLSLAGVALFAASYALPWWNFKLVAPQYPKGLMLIIHLTGVTGDVAEINTINHYIGMGHIDDAATFERTYAAWLIGGLGLAVIAAILAAGKHLTTAAAWIAVSFPVGFVLDSQYWMYRFGHDLDPTAAIEIAPFTPTVIGAGKVGQFVTMATPAAGFWVAMLGVVMVAIAVWQRKKVCNVCPQAGTCGAVCPAASVRTPS